MSGKTTGLEDKVVVVTAAADGIGRAVAQAFCDEGSKLVLVDYDADGLDKAATELRLAGAELEAVVTDVTDEQACERVLEVALNKFSRVDILVNVVGGSRPGTTVADMSLEDWNAVVGFNLSSTFLMCKAVLPSMQKNRGGAIVNVASGAAVTGMKKNPAYVASKAGVIALTKTMAIDHGPEGIRVNSISPGPVRTSLMQRNRTPEEIAKMGRLSLTGRIAEPEEMANVVVFLASKNASYIMGENILVTGGGSTMI